MGKRTFKTKLKDGTKISVRLNDDTYDSFTIKFFSKEEGEEMVVTDEKQVEIYGLMDISIDAYEHFKAQQHGTTVGDLYNN